MEMKKRLVVYGIAAVSAAWLAFNGGGMSGECSVRDNLIEHYRSRGNTARVESTLEDFSYVRGKYTVRVHGLLLPALLGGVLWDRFGGRRR